MPNETADRGARSGPEPYCQRAEENGAPSDNRGVAVHGNESEALVVEEDKLEQRPKGRRPGMATAGVLLPAVAFLQAACGLPRLLSPGPPHALPGLGAVRTFAVVYEKQPIDKLLAFDMLILEPEAYEAAELQTLRRQGKILIGYLNVGEIESYRPYAAHVPPAWRLAPNLAWEEHFFIDAGRRGWRRILQEEAIPPILAKGFQGLFLDSVDLAAPWRFPRQAKPMAALIRWLHETYPEQLIILNNAGFLLDRVAGSVHGLLVEEVFLKSDARGLMARQDSSASEAMLRELLQARVRWAIPVFVVDYCNDPERSECARAAAQARRQGLVQYITDVRASRLYPQWNVGY